MYVTMITEHMITLYETMTDPSKIHNLSYLMLIYLSVSAKHGNYFYTFFERRRETSNCLRTVVTHEIIVVIPVVVVVGIVVVVM
jgi:hypothetical protein